MKPLHISLNTAHSACKPSSFISSFTHSYQVLKSSSPYLHISPPPPPHFYRPTPNHPPLLRSTCPRSVCLCSGVWKAWSLPIFLISVLALRLLWVVLVWDPQLEVILLCRDTEQSGVQGLLLWLVRNVGTNGRLDSEIYRLVLRLLLDTWKHTCSELVFLIRHALLSLYYIL